MPSTVKLPLELSSLALTAPNAYWIATSGTFDYGQYVFVDNTTARLTMWGIVPQQVVAAENWGLVMFLKASSGSGNVAFTIAATSIAHAETMDGPLTTIVTTTAISLTAAPLLSTITLGTYDSTLSLEAGELFFAQITREGANAADTLGVDMFMYGCALRVDVTS
jgi:hypothetical protein